MHTLNKRVVIRLLSYLVVCLLLGAAPKISSADSDAPSEIKTPQVLVSQFMYDVPANDAGKEYIVIKNYEEEPVDISGYMIGNGIHQGGGGGMAAFPTGTIIEPDEEMFLVQSGLIFKEVYGASPDFEFPWFGPFRPEDDPDVPDMLPTDWSTGYLQLNNNGDQILLMDPEYNIVDFVPYIKDIEYRGVFYEAVTDQAPGDGNSIHRVDRTGDLRVDFKAAMRVLPEPEDLSVSTELLITEVMYQPYLEETEGEYVEITNITDRPIDMSGYYLGDKVVEGGAANEGMFNFPEGAIIQPYEVMVIARNSKGIENLYGIKASFEMEETDPEVPKMVPNCDWGCGNYQLGNTGDEVLLLDEDKNLVDAVVWKNGLFRGMNAHHGVNAKGRSLERISAEDTKDSAADFVEQPNPTPGEILFGPNGRSDLIPEIRLKDDVLQVNEPDNALVAGPTVIDASNGMPNSIPQDVPSFLLNVDLDEDGTVMAINRNTRLSEALDFIKGRMLPVLELSEKQVIEPVQRILEEKELTDVLIVSEDPEIVGEMRTLNDEYRGAVRFEGTLLDEDDLRYIVKAVRRSSSFVAMINHQTLTRENVEYLRKRGITVWAYGVETESESHRMIAHGVAGIETVDHSVVTTALAEYEAENSIHQQPFIVAHRGMSALAPENTMPAFELAVEMGIELIELDVHASKDGIPVVIHDYIVDRTTDGTGKVRDLTLEELKQLTANKTDYDERKDNYDQYPEAKIPTLEEVLQYIQNTDVVLLIEFKGVGFEEDVVQLIEHYDMVADVYITSFNLDALKRIQDLNQEIGINYTQSASRPEGSDPLQYAEKFITENVQLGMFPMFTNNSSWTADSSWTPELISYAKHRGVPFTAATFNTKKGIQDMMKLGSTVILSDYAHWMEKVPVAVNPGAETHEVMVGDTVTTDSLGATVSFRKADPEPISGGIRVVGTNDDIVVIDENGEVEALQEGEVILQIYHNYQPFNIPVDGDPMLFPDTWRIYSPPITLKVTDEEINIQKMLDKLDDYREEIFSDKAYRSLQVHLISVGQFENQEKAEKVVKHMENFKFLLEQQLENESISEEIYTILQSDANSMIEKWE